MKNVYLYIMFFAVMGMSAQNLQNANWYYGYQRGMTFLTNINSPQPLTNSVMNTLEGCATISDTQGNLLFYTNGVNVWNKNHLPMLNGQNLKGNNSSSQSAIIVARPGVEGHYYIVTIDGFSGAKKGLFYSEVDMSLDSTLGGIIANKKNIALKDEVGTDINESWTYNGDNNLFETLTSTYHANGEDYWIVTHIKDKIFSYKVTSAGIVNFPVFSSSTFSLGRIGYIKISPNGQRISEVNAGSVISIGSFNNATGLAAMNNNVNVDVVLGLYSIEFSPDSQNIFVGGIGKTFYTTGSSPVQAYDWSTSVHEGLQLAINGKIYVTGNTVGVINNPNNIANPGFGTVSNLSTNGGLGFPQWVYIQSPCTSLILTSEPNSGTFIYFNKSDITAQTAYMIDPGKDITMHAQDFIVLKPDTHIKSGAIYLAEIQDCETGAGTSPRMAAPKETEQEPKTLLAGKTFTLIPNPATTRVSISASVEVQSVLVTSIDGKVMFSREYKDKSATVELDINTYAQGYYTVTVITTDGQVQTQKLIKN